jgi:acetyl esterase/lipase
MSDTEVKRDLEFANLGGRSLKLDVFRPRGRSNRTAVLMLHGGAWERGSKDLLAPHAEDLAAQGFVAITAEYRLTGEARFPAQIHDVKRALRWARVNAQALGFDEDRLCLEGHSAGGHPALLAAGSPFESRLDPPEGDSGVSAAVTAVVAVYPPVLFHIGSERPSGAAPANALPGADQSEDMAALASPIKHVSADLPPVMLLHGDADKVVPVSTSLRYAEQVRAVGRPVDLHLFAGLPHGFANHPEFRPIMMGLIGAFFRRTVAEPEAFIFGPSRAEQAAAARARA